MAYVDRLYMQSSCYKLHPPTQLQSQQENYLIEAAIAARNCSLSFVRGHSY